MMQRYNLSSHIRENFLHKSLWNNDFDFRAVGFRKPILYSRLRIHQELQTHKFFTRQKNQANFKYR